MTFNYVTPEPTQAAPSYYKEETVQPKFDHNQSIDLDNYETNLTWKREGKKDPHGDQYQKGRETLALSRYDDDQLGNMAFMFYDQKLSVEEMITQARPSPIALMTAVKERLRWLSRFADKAIDLAKFYRQKAEDEAQWRKDVVAALAWYDAHRYPINTNRSPEECTPETTQQRIDSIIADWKTNRGY